jgi:hypothetical protein
MYYLDDRNNPVMSNAPASTWKILTQKEYDILVKSINDKAKADREALELSTKPQQEHEAEIQKELRAMAEERIAAKEKRG